MRSQPEHDRVHLTLDEASTILSFEIQHLRDVMVDSFAPIVRRAYEIMVKFTSELAAPVGARYAIEVLGVTEADIRRADFNEVRLWNGRRLPIDSERLFAWLSIATPSDPERGS